MHNYANKDESGSVVLSMLLVVKCSIRYDFRN